MSAQPQPLAPPNLHKPSERVVLAQSTHSSIKFTITVGADLYIRPTVPFCTTCNRLRPQFTQPPQRVIPTQPQPPAPPNLRKPSEHVVLAQSTHSSIKFTITVGADLYIRPNALRLHNPNRSRPQFTQPPSRHACTTPTACATKFMQPPQRILSAQPQPLAPPNLHNHPNASYLPNLTHYMPSNSR